MSLPVVDFTLTDMHGGLTEFEGSVYLDDEFLVIDTRIKKFGGLSTDDKTVKIEPKALASIRLREGVIVDQICLRSKTDELLSAVPGKHSGEVRLRVWRIHRREARRLVDEVERRMD